LSLVLKCRKQSCSKKKPSNDGKNYNYEISFERTLKSETESAKHLLTRLALYLMDEIILSVDAVCIVVDDYQKTIDIDVVE
jgi:hypothetical protein